MGRSAAIFGAVLFVASAASAQAPAMTDDDLYKAETVVTGTGEAERMRGFRIVTEEAIIKLTGNAGLAGSARIEPILGQAAGLIAEFTYEDRMKSIPVHDEQGTRDRPHFLRVRFDKAKLDAALTAANLRKWGADRPLLAVWLGIREGRGKYVLAADGPAGYGQREVLKEASKKRGVPIVLPPAGSAVITYESIDKGLFHILQQESQKLGAAGVLYGMLDFDGNVGWNTRWTLSAAGGYGQWAMKSVTFDVALKGAIEEAAAVLTKRAK
jgi:uncharacterized protein